MDVKTKLHVTKNIWQWFSCDTYEYVMYEFHHDYIKYKYGNNAGLLFTDTDSLLYEVKSIKNQRMWRKMLFQEYALVNTKMFC